MERLEEQNFAAAKFTAIRDFPDCGTLLEFRPLQLFYHFVAAPHRSHSNYGLFWCRARKIKYIIEASVQYARPPLRISLIDQRKRRPVGQ